MTGRSGPDLAARRAGLLVPPAGLEALRGDGAVVVEVWRSPAERLAGAAVAVPGARIGYVSEHFAGRSPADLDAHLLPTLAEVLATLESWDVEPSTRVVVYAGAGQGEALAARAWFILRWAGVRDVRVLDGGAAAWRAWHGAEGRGTADGDAAVPAAVDHPVSSLTAEQAAVLGHSGRLLDARGGAAYEGVPGDPGTGHIPGARSAPSSQLFVDGRLRPAEDLLAWARHHGVDGDSAVGAYCGRGVAAAATTFALATVGIDVGLYVGSWADWRSDPGRPVVQGPRPFAEPTDVLDAARG